ncbi:MAG: hypothetical protein AAGK14_01580 [Verrucomicrobiota bacterium]
MTATGKKPCCQAIGPPRAQPASGLTLQQKAARLAHALRKWRRSGAPLVARDVYRRRLDVCQACAHYRAEGNLGLGECAVCGCTRAKLWLATAACPHPEGVRWRAEAT